MTRLTLKAVNKALTEIGCREELVKAPEGHFYFTEGAAHCWPATIVYAFAVNQLTLDQWLESWRSLHEAYLDTHDYADEAKLIAAALNERDYVTNKVRPDDVCDWYEYFEGGDCQVAEVAMRKVIGNATYEAYDSLARLEHAVRFHLGLTTTKVVGGIDVSKVY